MAQAIDATDLTAEILPRLPTHLRDVTQAVGERLGCPVRFCQAKHLPGKALAKAQIIEGQPIVLLRQGLDTDEGVLAEELLHLQRWAEGQPGVQEEVPGYGLVCVFLSGLIDEYAFSPQLEKWGYDRSSDLEQILQTYLAKLESEILPQARHPVQSTGLEHSWFCCLALEYGRAILLAKPTATRDAFLRAYEHPDLRTAKEAGEKIAAAIRENPDLTPDGTACLIKNVLCKILNVPDGAYSIQFPARS